MTRPREVDERHDVAGNDDDVILRVCAGDHAQTGVVERMILGHLGPEFGLDRPGVRGSGIVT